MKAQKHNHFLKGYGPSIVTTLWNIGIVSHRLHVWSQLVVVVSYRLSVLWSDAALTYNLQLT